MRQAACISENAMQAGLDVIAEGVPEYEVAQSIYSASSTVLAVYFPPDRNETNLTEIAIDRTTIPISGRHGH